MDGSYQEGTSKPDALPEPVPVSTIAGTGDTSGNQPAAGIPLPNQVQHHGSKPEPVPVSTIAGTGDTAGNRPAAGIPPPDPVQQPGRKPAPVQGSLFEA
ncbi:MAG: hypothetical protein WCR52_12845 [Bacteroidota bacterium]